MLTRRHIRVKVMQGLYAMTQTTEDTLEKEKKFLSLSMEKYYLFIDGKPLLDNIIRLILCFINFINLIFVRLKLKS